MDSFDAYFLCETSESDRTKTLQVIFESRTLKFMEQVGVIERFREAAAASDEFALTSAQHREAGSDFITAQ